jgi:hypothetical protein
MQAAEQGAAAEKSRAVNQLKSESNGLRAEWRSNQQTAVEAARSRAADLSTEGLQTVAKHQADAKAEAAVHYAEGQRKADEMRRQAEAEGRTERAKSGQQSGGVLGWIASSAKSVAGGVAQAVGSVLDRARAAIRSVMDTARALATAVMERARQVIAATVRRTVDVLSSLAPGVMKTIGALAQRFRKEIVARINQAREFIGNVVAGLRRAVAVTLQRLGRALSGSIAILERGWQATIATVRSVVERAVAFARSAIAGLGAFASIILDVAADPGRWLRNLATSIREGLQHHVFPQLLAAVRGWFDDKLGSVLGLGAATWSLLQRGGITMAAAGQMAWETVKAMIPQTVISILIERLVSMLVPAAGAALLIVQGIQAAWASASRILQAFDAFMTFLKRVRWGDAAALFGNAVTLASVAVIDFLSNLLLQRIAPALGKVAKKLRLLAKGVGDVASHLVGKAMGGAGHIRQGVIRTWQSFRQAGRLIAEAKRGARLVRPDLHEVAKDCGGELVGLKNEIKTRRSLTEKIGRRSARGRDPAIVARETKDVLRYTVTFDAESYVDSALRMESLLRAKGYQPKELRVLWGEGRAYQGYNTTWTAPTGHTFELQIHTSGSEGSWYAKEFLTHKTYEKLRKETDPVRQRQLYDEMVEKMKHVKVPSGVGRLGTPIPEGRP